MMLQRDAFIEEIKKRLETDKDIYFLSADFGAAALDSLRETYPDNFIHCGISEQAMIDIATGLALKGKKVFCYAMAPFISLRAIEQIKCGPSMMNLPITIMSVGIGIGYADAGPTHYITEDFACMRSILNLNMYTLADASSAKRLANKLLDKPELCYVRFDRHDQPELPVTNFKEDLTYRLIGDMITTDKVLLIGSGKMSHIINEVCERNKLTYKVVGVDLIRAKPFPNTLTILLEAAKGAIVIDEQTPSGSLGAAVLEAMSEKNILKKVKVITLPEEYLFENGGREYLLKKHGLSADNIEKVLNDNF
jgi:transketolase